MPKGATSRPDNRRVRQARRRQENRMILIKKVLNNGNAVKNLGVVDSAIDRRILNSAGAKRDKSILAQNKQRAFVRRANNESEKLYLTSIPSDRKRERLPTKKK